MQVLKNEKKKKRIPLRHINKYNSIKKKVLHTLRASHVHFSRTRRRKVTKRQVKSLHEITGFRIMKENLCHAIQ